MKKNKIAIIIVSAVVIAWASGAYFLNQFQSDGSSTIDKDTTIIQNNSNNSKLDKNEETKGNFRGLGLYNIKNIIESLNGSLKLTSDKITTWEVEI